MITMITRRWSQWVYGLYTDEDTLLGGRLVEVVDEREDDARLGVEQPGPSLLEGAEGHVAGGPDTDQPAVPVPVRARPAMSAQRVERVPVRGKGGGPGDASRTLLRRNVIGPNGAYNEDGPTDRLPTPAGPDRTILSDQGGGFD
jgi:hypothetical protein